MYGFRSIVCTKPIQIYRMILFCFKLTHDVNYNIIVPIRQVAAALNTAIFADFVSFHKWHRNPLKLPVIIHNSFFHRNKKQPARSYRNPCCFQYKRDKNCAFSFFAGAVLYVCINKIADFSSICDDSRFSLSGDPDRDKPVLSAARIDNKNAAVSHAYSCIHHDFICPICDAHRIRCEITDVSRPTALHRRHPVNKDRS